MACGCSAKKKTTTATPSTHVSSAPTPGFPLLSATEQANLRTAVARGAHLLDRATPNWFRTEKIKTGPGSGFTVETMMQSVALADPALIEIVRRDGKGLYFTDFKRIDGGYFGFYYATQVGQTGRPQTSFSGSMDPTANQLLTDAWLSEIRSRRTAKRHASLDNAGRALRRQRAAEASRMGLTIPTSIGA